MPCPKPSIFVLFLLSLGLFCACRQPNQIKINEQMPARVLWAWEREEDLRFLDPEKFAVAFYAQTLTLQTDEVLFRPRRQKLEIPPNLYLIAVTRIETVKETPKRPAFNAEQRRKLVDLIKNTLARPQVKAVQIDFDAAVSERDFYRSLIADLKNALPADTPLSITSLASWCVGDNWYNDFPVDEAVPMIFRMGADDRAIRDYLGRGRDWREPLCRGSYGLAVEEPVRAEFKAGRRFYYFKSSAWSKSDLDRLQP
jgi:hypothetical protein